MFRLNNCLSIKFVSFLNGMDAIDICDDRRWVIHWLMVVQYSIYKKFI